jgi:hypothetical protein
MSVATKQSSFVKTLRFVHPPLSYPRRRVSSTPRPLGSIADTSEYWITRRSLSSGGAFAPTRWRVMTAEYVARSQHRHCERKTASAPVTTSTPRKEQARTAIPSQTWRSPDVCSGFATAEFNGVPIMTTTQQDKPGGKPRQRNRKDQRGQKPEQENPKPDRHDEDQIAAMTAAADASTNGTVATNGAVAPADAPLMVEVAPVDVSAIGEATPADKCPIGIQSIANVYSEYTRKSLEESNSLVAKLMGVRSLDKAIEVQIEFAKQAYANFVAESQKICELYSELARQSFRPWEGYAAKVTRGGR